MIANDERIDTQIAAIERIQKHVDAIKAKYPYGTVAWSEADMIEGALQGLSMFTALGRGRDTTA